MPDRVVAEAVADRVHRLVESRRPFAVIGGTVIYVASVVMTFGLLFGAKRFNMQANDLILLLPLGIAGLFYWLLKGSKLGNE